MRSLSANTRPVHLPVACTAVSPVPRSRNKFAGESCSTMPSCVTRDGDRLSGNAVALLHWRPPAGTPPDDKTRSSPCYAYLQSSGSWPWQRWQDWSPLADWASGAECRPAAHRLLVDTIRPFIGGRSGFGVHR
ncbi:hypothetical protein GCM10011581_45820 [Saccharopolyspora subtropica]|uniref:Uncharacterized protein n=1 Tax=Saccharopolyspora thermophila TaxID=89367 RepID=A0A917NIQ5_9PSEU|nr:hypothetical protein GCM10011581_45820 [Saccharopolyspora subtropica]